MSFIKQLRCGIGLLKMIVGERLSQPMLARQPEPKAAMDDWENVEAFHRAGAQYLMPVYHFNALAVSRLAPKGGTVVDLGSGSGQFLAYLAQRRPDLRIIGLDLSESMVEAGQRYIDRLGLQDRIALKLGDMTRFMDLLPDSVDVVSSVFALHHLPGQGDLHACFEQIAATHARYGNAVWLFDFVRPMRPATPMVFPEILTPDADAAFKQDSTHSLTASWSYGEMLDSLAAAGLGQASHSCARIMRLYQAHWVSPAGSIGQQRQAWMDDDESRKTLHVYKQLKWLLPCGPQARNN
jgi:SAM-dependent methyltransferase